MKIEGGLTEGEKELFIEDLRAVCGEYFEGDGKYSVDIAEMAEDRLSVCIVFDAVRARKFRSLGKK